MALSGKHSLWKRLWIYRKIKYEYAMHELIRSVIGALRSTVKSLLTVQIFSFQYERFCVSAPVSINMLTLAAATDGSSTTKTNSCEEKVFLSLF